MNNYAFIDTQNVHLGIKSLGWKIDWKKLRIYLKEKYNIVNAYLFIGFIEENQRLYKNLRKNGFEIIFKPTVHNENGEIKGNCDADMVLHTILKIEKYDKAVIISSDGDFYSLVRHLYENNKLLFVLSPYVKTCSRLLRKEAKEKIYSMDNLRHKIGV